MYVLTSRDYLIVNGDYSRTIDSMGQSSSLTPGGGSVYQQLRGGSEVVTSPSTGHKVYLDIPIPIVMWSSWEVDV